MNFLIKNNNKNVKVYQKTFVLANTNIKIIENIFLLSFQIILFIFLKK